jgi:hypothetical protein
MDSFLYSTEQTGAEYLNGSSAIMEALLPWPCLAGKYYEFRARKKKQSYVVVLRVARKKRKYLVVIIHAIQYIEFFWCERYHPVILHKPIQIDRLSCNRSID